MRLDREFTVEAEKDFNFVDGKQKIDKYRNRHRNPSLGRVDANLLVSVVRRMIIAAVVVVGLWCDTIAADSDRFQESPMYQARSTPQLGVIYEPLHLRLNVNSMW